VAEPHPWTIDEPAEAPSGRWCILMPSIAGTMMIHMRTTLTLDEDVWRLVEDQVHQRRASVKQVVNDALRAALAPQPERSAPYRVRVHHATLAPGLDLTGVNKLADEIEDEAVIRRADQ
jgi:hypothetical protein